MRLLRFLPVLGIIAAFMLAGVASANGSGGVSGPAIYVDGTLYRTVATPTDLAGTGAPDQSYDTIYNFGGVQPSVADAAPGDPDYNGGRWMVHAVSFNTNMATTVAMYDANGSGDLDSDAEVLAAIADAGPAGVTDHGIVKLFVCTLNKAPKGH
ncbi:MAG TPA: hypothetical protein PKA95_17890 [Thermomicrobiales bacterium]|nr:hypothetical protein [Thermomicrobiales bacterium]